MANLEITGVKKANGNYRILWNDWTLRPLSLAMLPSWVQDVTLPITCCKHPRHPGLGRCNSPDSASEKGNYRPVEPLGYRRGSIQVLNICEFRLLSCSVIIVSLVSLASLLCIASACICHLRLSRKLLAPDHWPLASGLGKQSIRQAETSRHKTRAERLWLTRRILHLDSVNQSRPSHAGSAASPPVVTES